MDSNLPDYGVSWERAVPHAPEHWGIMTEHLPRYLYASHYVKGLNVLDDGTGTGYGAAVLAEAGAACVVGVDLAEDALNYATNHYSFDNLHYVRMDACNLGFSSGHFDVVTSFEAIEHMVDPARYLSEIARVLKPDGLLILSTPNREAWRPSFFGRVFATSPYHLTEFSLVQLHDLIKPHFRYIARLGQSTVPPLAIGLTPASHEEKLECQRLGRLVVSGRYSSTQPPQFTEVGWFDADNDPEHSAYHFIVCSNEPLGVKEYCPNGLAPLKTLSDAVLYAYNLYRWDPDHSVWTLSELESQLKEKNNHIETLQKQAAELEKYLARAFDELGQRDDRLREKIRYIEVLQEQLVKLQEELTRSLDQLREKVRYIELLQADHTRLQLDFATKMAEVASLRHEFEKVWLHLQALRQTRTVRLSRSIGFFADGLASMLKGPVESARRIRATGKGRLPHFLKGPIQGAVDLPERGSIVSGALFVSGWAFSTAAAIVQVQIFLDETKESFGSIRYGLARPDVINVRPWQEEINCGYSGTVDLASHAPGPITLVIRVTDDIGNKQDFRRPLIVRHKPEDADSARATGSYLGSVAVDTPSAEIERAVLRGNIIEIEGWAVWPTSSYPRVARILVNDKLVGETRVNLSRPDISQQFQNHPNATRCGFRFLRSLGSSQISAEKTETTRLTIEFIEGRGGRFKRSLEIVREAQAAQIAVPEIWAQFEDVIADYQSRFDDDPSILDWNTGHELALAFPGYAVFSPPSADSVLPYIDHSVDIVVVSSQDPFLVAEARRVAHRAVVIFSASEPPREEPFDGHSADWNTLFRVEWQSEERSVEWPTTSIIVPVHNQTNYTESCLRALRNTLPRDFRGEIIIVDDASTDDTAIVLDRWVRVDERIRVLRNSQNLGFIDSCNRGAESATGDVLIFLNNDTVPQPRWLPPLLRILCHYPDAGAVGGKLIYPDGRLQEAGGVIFSDGSGANFGKNDEEANMPLYNYVREVDYCSGALLATRRSLFREIGGFDTTYRPAYYEDTDYCFNVREKGYRVYYQPESVVVHYEGGTAGTDLSSGVKQYQTMNHTRFVQKWSRVLRRQPSPPERFDFATWHALAVRDGVEGTKPR